MEVRDAGTKLKNAIDWGARPYCQNAWSGKPGPLRPVFETLLERLFFDGPAASATGKITASANSLRSSRHHVHSAR